MNPTLEKISETIGAGIIALGIATAIGVGCYRCGINLFGKEYTITGQIKDIKHKIWLETDGIADWLESCHEIYLKGEEDPLYDYGSECHPKEGRYFRFKVEDRYRYLFTTHERQVQSCEEITKKN